MTIADHPEPARDGRTVLKGYLSLARFDHATKHVFILPGVLLALLLRGLHADSLIANVVLGFLSAVCIASANYVINEWLDRAFDAHHPKKSQRSSVQLPLRKEIVYSQYAALLLIGLSFAAAVNTTFLAVSAIFAVMGIVYNVEPLRSKDKPFVDVFSEALNNPIRLTLGWTMVDPGSLPPLSLVLAYWLGGAFLMNAKRMSEYRDLTTSVGKAQLARYRRSFAYYTENRLITACLLYAMFCGSFLSIFLLKYRIEYILFLPFVGILFAVYFGLSLKPNSIAQEPEYLFKSKILMATVTMTVAAFAVLTLIDLPWLETLSAQSFVELPVGVAP